MKGLRKSLGMIESDWTKLPWMLTRNRELLVSVVFTWQLPYVRKVVCQRSLVWDTARIGGPAVQLVPDYFQGIDGVQVGGELPGAIQLHNPMATRTTMGCPRACAFCAVKRLDGEFRELEDWPDLPILIDNNLLAASERHFQRVINRLVQWGVADFNQGLDSRLLTAEHARLIKLIKRPMIRLALDNISYRDDWDRALDILLQAGIPKRRIRSYALLGFRSDPSEGWARCEYIQSKGIRVLPAWYHRLDTLKHNIVTDEQRGWGWTDYERRRIMQWFYKHKQAIKYGGEQ